MGADDCGMTDATNSLVTSIEAVEQGLGSAGYIASRQIATAVFLAERLEKPILVEIGRAHV